MLDILKHCP